jgi:exodeoxyribonuclease VII large subunit
MSHPLPQLLETQALTVTELTYQIREVLDEVFPDVSVIGEASGPKWHTNGHLYFTLKDANAQLKCVMWSSKIRKLKFQVEQGQQLMVRGKIDLYPQHGAYQLIVESMTPQGMGELELAFRQLYDKLQARGWFAPERKRPLPRFPRRIGILTSASGAAIHDMLRIIRERWPIVEIWVVPVPVQGDTAAEQIAQAIVKVNSLQDKPDVLIVGRGGGSLEDLWAFNEEVLAAAIVASAIPIISAVGHETDTTIADLVADLRAPTPSKAADLIVPNREEQCHRLDMTLKKLHDLIIQRLIWDMSRLQHLASHRFFVKPLERFQELQGDVENLAAQLQTSVIQTLRDKQRSLAEQASLLAALSPLHVLARGYSVTRKANSGETLLSARQLHTGEIVETLLQEGRLLSRVEQAMWEDFRS